MWAPGALGQPRAGGGGGGGGGGARAPGGGAGWAPGGCAPAGGAAGGGGAGGGGAGCWASTGWSDAAETRRAANVATAMGRIVGRAPWVRVRRGENRPSLVQGDRDFFAGTRVSRVERGGGRGEAPED